MYSKYLKRLLDVVFSLLGLIVLSPVMLLAALLIRIDSKGPVIFCQERLGLWGKPFMLYKLRSMHVGAEHVGSGVFSMKGDARVTRVGRFLRASSMDELPQLINILKGEMSFVGPRPALTYHPWPIKDYSPEQRQMFAVRPGVTGWAQIHGRKAVEWNQRIALNVWYTGHVSFWLDVRICAATVMKVLLNMDNVNVSSTVAETKHTAELENMPAASKMLQKESIAK